MGNKAKLPPVPAEQLSPQGSSTPGQDEIGQHGGTAVEGARHADVVNRNQDEKGRQGDIWQNTHHKGYQQDR